MTVYFARRADGAIKIGWTERDPAVRARDQGYLTLLGVYDGGRQLERELHARFAASRLKGEFFRLTPELKAVVSASRPYIPEPAALLVRFGRADRSLLARISADEGARVGRAISSTEALRRLVRVAGKLARDGDDGDAASRTLFAQIFNLTEPA